MKSCLTHRYFAASLTLLAFMMIATASLSANTDTLRSEGAKLSDRAGDISGKMIGPFNSKSSVEPWIEGRGYETLQKFVASADQLSRKLMENKELSSTGERLLKLNSKLKKNVQAIPALDGSDKIGGVLEEIRETLQQIHSLDF